MSDKIRQIQLDKLYDVEPAVTSTLQVDNAAPTLAWNTTSVVGTVDGVDLTVKMPANPNSDTKNTAGSTDTSSKIFLIGATSQAANPQTYSHDTAYVGTDGCLYSNSKKVVVTDDSRLSDSRTPTPHSHASSEIAAMTGYSKPSSTSAIAAADTLNAAIGKLEKALDGKQASGSYLTSHQTIKQDGITGATVNRFGTCSTAAATAAKTVSITTGTFSLEAGARVAVKFTNANTAANPTLNVNSKGAKSIFYKGSQITTGATKALLVGVVEFIYDGTQFHLLGNYELPAATSSTLGGVKVSFSNGVLTITTN